MTDNLSPLARRALAFGLFLLGLLILVDLVGTVAGRTKSAADRLEDARHQLARLEAIRSRPAPPQGPPPPPGSAWNAPRFETAAALAAAAAGAAAAVAELPLESAEPSPPDPANSNLIRLSIRIAGPEDRLLRFVSALERGSPTLRLLSWRITREPGADGAATDAVQLRLDGVAGAAWGEKR